MSTEMEVPLQSELIECLVNARHWLLCMGANLIGDICWGHREPQSAGETCPLQIVFAMFISVQSLSHVRLFATLWTAAHQGSLFFTTAPPGKPMCIFILILVCCSSWGCKESDMTEQLNWTEHTTYQILFVIGMFFQQDWGSLGPNKYPQ